MAPISAQVDSVIRSIRKIATASAKRTRYHAILEAPECVLVLDQRQRQHRHRAVVEPRCARRSTLVRQNQQYCRGNEQYCAEELLELDVEVHRVRQHDVEEMREEHPVVVVRRPQCAPRKELRLRRADGVDVGELVTAQNIDAEAGDDPEIGDRGNRKAERGHRVDQPGRELVHQTPRLGDPRTHDLCFPHLHGAHRPSRDTTTDLIAGNRRTDTKPYESNALTWTRRTARWGLEPSLWRRGGLSDGRGRTRSL